MPASGTARPPGSPRKGRLGLCLAPTGHSRQMSPAAGGAGRDGQRAGVGDAVGGHGAGHHHSPAWEGAGRGEGAPGQRRPSWFWRVRWPLGFWLPVCQGVPSPVVVDGALLARGLAALNTPARGQRDWANQWARDQTTTNQSPSLRLSYSYQEKAALPPLGCWAGASEPRFGLLELEKETRPVGREAGTMPGPGAEPL